MIYIIGLNAVVLMGMLIYFWISKSNAAVHNKILHDKEDALMEHIENYNQFVDSFDNFYKNKTYQVGMGFLHLKKYQEDLLEVLDPAIDGSMIVKIHLNIHEIEDTLKELSFLSKYTIRKGKGKMIEPIHFDESVFSKN